MNAPKHTPGPWILFNCTDGKVRIYNHENHPIYICTVGDGLQGLLEVSQANVKIIAAAPKMANAKLIAAAPKMATALNSVSDLITAINNELGPLLTPEQIFYLKAAKTTLDTIVNEATQYP